MYIRLLLLLRSFRLYNYYIDVAGCISGWLLLGSQKKGYNFAQRLFT